MSDEEASRVWEAMRNSPFRHVVEYELEKRKLSETEKCAKAGPHDVERQQGVVDGLLIAIGILNRKG